MRSIFCSLFLFLFLNISLNAQSDSLRLEKTDSSTIVLLDSMAVDSSIVVRKRGMLHKFWRGDYPNPKKALIIGLALPGAGQIYNKKYWKTPIFYAGMGTLIYFEVDHVRNFRVFQRNYKAAVDENPDTVVDAKYSLATDAQLKVARDQRQAWLEYTAVGMGVLYLVAVADAFVDAHLASFDVSDDLTLRLKPQIEQNALGLGIALSFK